MTKIMFKSKDTGYYYSIELNKFYIDAHMINHVRNLVIGDFREIISYFENTIIKELIK